MTTILVALAVGALLGGAWWWALRATLSGGGLDRTNHRGSVLPTAAGIVVPLAVVTVVAVLLVADAVGRELPWWVGTGTMTLVAAVGFALLGLFDDVAGVGQSGGFRGHLRALRRGQVTSGAAKLVGGAALGIVLAGQVPVVEPVEVPALAALLRDGAVVALTANLVNLFDRRPGRAVKVATLGFVATAAVSRSAALALPAVGVGAALGVLWPDLRERCMLGDTGANALGGLCGLGLLIAATSGVARWTLLVALVVLNALSEVVSFSTVIDRVAPLRWADRLGGLARVD